MICLQALRVSPLPPFLQVFITLFLFCIFFAVDHDKLPFYHGMFNKVFLYFIYCFLKQPGSSLIPCEGSLFFVTAWFRNRNKLSLLPHFQIRIFFFLVHLYSKPSFSSSCPAYHIFGRLLKHASSNEDFSDFFPPFLWDNFKICTFLPNQYPPNRHHEKMQFPTWKIKQNLISEQR